MTKTTVSTIRNSRIPANLGICPSDERLLLWLNEAREQLINRAVGGWWGQTVRAKFCLDNGCIVWPREVGFIHALSVCGKPIAVRNGWWQFIENLNHVENCDSCACGCQCNEVPNMQWDETTVPTNSPIAGTDKTIRVYPSDIADAGKTMIFQGYDKNGIWVRTTIGGVVSDGERVTLALPYVDTVTEWQPGSPTGVIREATKYRVLVYEHDTVADTDRLISTYQPDETLPNYRRSIIPGLSGTTCSARCCDCDDELPAVEAIVKLAYAPVSADNDWVYPGNTLALKAAMMSRKRDEEQDDTGAEVMLQKGLRELRLEHRANTGDIQHVYVNINKSAPLSLLTRGFI